MDQQSRIATIIDDQSWSLTVPEIESLFSACPILFERFAFPSKNGNTCWFVHSAITNHDRRGRFVLSGKDVTGYPTDFRTELDKRLDQNRGLNSHVQTAHDSFAGKRFAFTVLLTQRHQARHFLLGKIQLLAPHLSQ